MAQRLYKFWVVLLALSGGIALWFSAIALSGLWNFTRMNEHSIASVSNWEVLDLPSSRFAIAADYRYEVKGKAYNGKTIFENPRFLNRFAAENYVKMMDAQTWKVWYRKGRPSFSSLEKEFPQKQCLQALLTVGVFAYFYFARSMVSKFI